MRTRGTRLLIFVSLYSRRSFLLISLAFESIKRVGIQKPVKLTEIEWVFKSQWNKPKWPPGIQRRKDQQTGSPCSHLPSFFRENCRHCPSSSERNWKKWNAGQVVPWTTCCSVLIAHVIVNPTTTRPRRLHYNDKNPLMAILIKPYNYRCKLAMGKSSPKKCYRIWLLIVVLI